MARKTGKKVETQEIIPDAVVAELANEFQADLHLQVLSFITNRDLARGETVLLRKQARADKALAAHRALCASVMRMRHHLHILGFTAEDVQRHEVAGAVLGSDFNLIDDAAMAPIDPRKVV